MNTLKSITYACIQSEANRRLTRRDKRKFEDSGDALPTGAPETRSLEREHEKVKNIEQVQVGRFLLDTWYYSPYPQEFRQVKKLYVCEFCLKYMQKLSTLEAHKKVCLVRHPPGNEIYRDGNTSVFEVDGNKHKVYCQCLCLLAKLFIDHKTLYYDVEPFLFYIMCECDSDGYRVVGYFSKEKDSPEGYNVACILTFPQYQRRGYGRFLIALSYELSKIEGKVGSPERPLSDLGKVSYRSYWTRVLLDLLASYKGANPSIKEVSTLTAIKREDIISTLQYLGLMRYVKGQHVIAATPRLLEQHALQAQLVAATAPVPASAHVPAPGLGLETVADAVASGSGVGHGIPSPAVKGVAAHVAFDRRYLTWTPPVFALPTKRKRIA